MAVCTEEPAIGYGNYYKPNFINRCFLVQWYETRDWFGKLNILSINGEPFNGANLKEFGDQNISSDMNDQLLEAYKLCKVFRAKLFILTEGSGYHVRRDQTNYEQMLAEKLNALPCDPYLLPDKLKVHQGQKELVFDDTGTSRVAPFVTFRLNGVNVNFAHHVGYSRRYYYRSTALTAEMTNLEFDRGYYYPVDQNLDIIGRGHVHYNVYIEFPSTRGFVTPCWKMPDRHLFRHGLSGTRPSVGACKIIIEQNGEIHYQKLMAKVNFPKPYIPDLTELSGWTEKQVKLGRVKN